ncbi:MAG: SUMF1/EgtB/PvdO family nonheme iron enzyme, partial [Pseudomonadota bacterium]
AEFRRFCVELEGCTQAELETLQIDERLPVTGVGLETVQAFARWLSEQTGHSYRLPTREEWLWAAQGDPDPNRNCRVDIEGIDRGRAPVAAATGQSNGWGLKNMLGNVQEWVVGETGLVAIGGTYSDPIGLCLATTERSHPGEPAVDTGFRLVREIS